MISTDWSLDSTGEMISKLITMAIAHHRFDFSLVAFVARNIVSWMSCSECTDCMNATRKHTQPVKMTCDDTNHGHIIFRRTRSIVVVVVVLW